MQRRVHVLRRPASSLVVLASVLLASVLVLVPHAEAEPPAWDSPQVFGGGPLMEVLALDDGQAVGRGQDGQWWLRRAGAWQTVPSPAAGTSPALGAQRQRTLFMPYLVGSTGAADLYVRGLDLDSGTWATAQLVATGVDGREAQLAYADDGSAVVMARGDGIRTWVRRPAGTWTEAAGAPGADGGNQISSARVVAMADGAFALVARRSSTVVAHRLTGSGTSWSVPQTLASGIRSDYNLEVAGWSGEHSSAVATFYEPDADYTVVGVSRAATLDASSGVWTVTTLPSTFGAADLDGATPGAVLLGVKDYSTTCSCGDVVTMRYDAATRTWAAPEVLAAGVLRPVNEMVSLADDGTAHATYGYYPSTTAPLTTIVARSQSSGAWATVHSHSDRYWTALDGTDSGTGVFTYRDVGAAQTLATVWDESGADLAAEIAPDLPPGGVAVGDEFDVAVTLESTDDLTDVALTLDVPGDALEIAEAPTGTTGATLAAGVPKTWTWRLRALEPGSSTLRVEASGKAGARTVETEAEQVVDVSTNALVFGAAVDPDPLALPVDDDGAVAPQTAQVTLTLRNSTDEPMTDVVLERAYIRPQVQTHLLDQLDFVAGTFPITVGTLAPDEEWTITLPVEVTGDGKRKVDLLASFEQDGSARVERGAGGTFEVTVPPLWWESELDGDRMVGDRPWVKGGRPFLLSGSVRNLSDWRRLCLAPLRPTLTGNAGGHGVVDLATFSAADQVAPPLAGALEPGDDTLFGMLVRTLPTGTARNRVQVAPAAYDLGDDAEAGCDAMSPGTDGTALTAAEVSVRSGSGDHLGGVDISVPMAPQRDWWQVEAADVTNLFGGFSLGAIETTALWLRGTAVGAKEAAVGYYEHPELLLPTTEALWAGAGLVHAYWDAATPEEKQHLYTQVGSVLRRAPGDAYAGLTKIVESSTADWMKRIETAHETGDLAQVWNAFGHAGGSLGAQIVIEIVQAELGVTLAKRLPAVGKTFAAVGAQTKTYKSMKAMPAGKLLNRTEMARLWGAAVQDIKHFTKIAKEEGVLIGIRGRAPVSVQNLKKGAVWKHENLKPKNVSDVDIKWLDFKKADKGLVAMRSYTKKAKDQILDRIKKAKISATQRAELIDRANTRFDEVDKYLAKINKFDKKGEIDVGFNYSENGLDVATDSKWRRFKLDVDSVGDGLYYRPFQESTLLKGGKLPKWCKNFGGTLKVLCRVTGDMDGVYVADASGRGLTKERLLRVYKKLADAGWQHPETFTWVDQMTGKFWFDAKEKILKGLEVGGEKMMEFAPDGLVRATHLNLKASRMTSAQDFFVARIGGFSAPLPAPLP
jgi:hypothetical protein